MLLDPVAVSSRVQEHVEPIDEVGPPRQWGRDLAIGQQDVSAERRGQPSRFIRPDAGHPDDSAANHHVEVRRPLGQFLVQRPAKQDGLPPEEPGLQIGRRGAVADLEARGVGVAPPRRQVDPQ